LLLLCEEAALLKAIRERLRDLFERRKKNEYFLFLALTKDVGGVDQHHRQGHHQSDQQHSRRHRDSRTYTTTTTTIIIDRSSKGGRKNNNNWRNGRIDAIERLNIYSFLHCCCVCVSRNKRHTTQKQIVGWVLEDNRFFFIFLPNCQPATKRAVMMDPTSCER